MLKIFLIFFSIINICNAQQYKRKEVKPGYFLPPKKQTIKKEIKRPEANVDTIVAEQIESNRAEFFESPEYTEIFNEYQKDIKQISDTHQFPDTSQIKEDFHGMNTNEPFLVK